MSIGAGGEELWPVGGGHPGTRGTTYRIGMGRAGERPGRGASAPSATTSRGVRTTREAALPTPSTAGADAILNARHSRTAIRLLSVD